MGKPLAISKHTLGEKAAQIIRERIITGEYTQGAKLIEEELASDFEISRASIRDAFLMLEGEGLLQRERNKSIRVLEFTEKRIEDLFWYRLGVENLCIDYCIEAHKDLSLVHKRLDELFVAAQEENFDAMRFVKKDLDFHAAIVETSDNMYARREWASIASQLLALLYWIYGSYEFKVRGIEQHRQVLLAMQKGDAQAAQELMRSHIRENMTHIRELSSRAGR
jgi:DNA-binding GntR family transcriptional regulator